MEKSAKILIAEDSPTQATRLRYMLEENSFDVRTARNGREALEAMQTYLPTIVITDINMPEVDGYELCRRIRATPDYASIPVILLTSLSDPEDVFRGLECGADNFVTKPYDEIHLLARIDYLLSNLHLRDQERSRVSIDVVFGGQNHVITSDRAQILNLLLSTYETAVQKNRELAKTRDDLARLNEQLEDKVTQRTASLAAEITERRRAEEQVRKLNDELELRVTQRTEQLRMANRELESFSYTVSHDLRAPLRHILGFANILVETEGSSPRSEEERRFLKLITDSAERMSKLINDLLDFSRMGRAELRTQEISLDEVVQSSLKDIENEAAGRKIDWDIATLGNIVGDFSMLRQVFVNLLGNAVKFTRKQPEAKIQVGTEPGKPGELLVFVRDNGAGFNMEYAQKLFGVFQRLHTQEDFEGTGIGLANVQRIILRHGGTIWAKGELGKGATFYFTLPRKGNEEKPLAPDTQTNSHS